MCVCYSTPCTYMYSTQHTHTHTRTHAQAHAHMHKHTHTHTNTHTSLRWQTTQNLIPYHYHMQGSLSVLAKPTNTHTHNYYLKSDDIHQPLMLESVQAIVRCLSTQTYIKIKINEVHFWKCDIRSIIIVTKCNKTRMAMYIHLQTFSWTFNPEFTPCTWQKRFRVSRAISIY